MRATLDPRLVPPALPLKIRQCSGESTTKASMHSTSFGCPIEFKVIASERASDSGLREPSSMFGLKPPPPKRVTADAPGAMPRSTPSGCQSGSDSSSGEAQGVLARPTQGRAGSIPPGTPPPTLRITSCNARPMLALARLPWPSAFTPEFMPMRRATGPLTTTIGLEKYVVQSSPCIANPGFERRFHRGEDHRPCTPACSPPSPR